MHHHQCSRRADHHINWTTFTNYWLLLTHLACLIALVAALLVQIDERSFLVGTTTSDAPPSVVPVYQTSVTTLLSIAIVTVRTLAGAWLTLTGWRLAFIILESNGTTLQGFSRLVRYRLPSKDSNSTPLFGVLSIIFIISIPVQFISPILTGAVSWIPELAMSPFEQANVTHPGMTTGWVYHQEFENDRFYEVTQAFAHTALATTANFSDLARHISRRRIPSMQDFPANSSVQEVIMPYLNIKSLEWVRSKDEVRQQMDLVTHITSNPDLNLSIIPSELQNPYLHGGDAGRATIAFEEEWQPNFDYPRSRVIKRSHYAVCQPSEDETAVTQKP
jgi:hypothetical protein